MTQLTVAFASGRHAESAMRFLRGAAFEIVMSVPVDGGAHDLARVDFAVDPENVDRLRTLVAGVRGIVLEERMAAGHAVA